ncbi:MAG: LPS export ABC transporter ATP-binding protein [Cyanobacteria bacterium P01_H01_bin.15]
MSLYLKNIHKSYNKRTIVSRLNLQVNPGEIVGLLGPNGAGKTTTFYIATGLIHPDAGHVWLDQQEITSLSLDARARLGIGYLAQQPSIFRYLSVADNLRLVLEQSGLPPHRQTERLEELMSEFQLQQVAQTLGSRVSGGERRRTEIARALAVGAAGPDFLLLDEPFAGIDPIAVGEIQSLLRQLRDRNLGLLITDHNVRETLAITDRAYILREGQILAGGTSAELYANNLVRDYYLGSGFQE